MTDEITTYIPEEVVEISSLKPHPRNYQEHPDDELEHIATSIKENGIYKNVVIAKDSTILAGHGVALAAEKMLGMTEIPARRLPLDPEDPRALKVLAGDNEIRHLAIVDDRALVGILKDINSYDDQALVGTGYDDMMLANLDAITRPPDVLTPHNENDQWVGLPEFEPAEEPFKAVVHFDSDEDRQGFLSMIGADQDSKYTMVQTRKAISLWWPLRSVKSDRANTKWEQDEDQDLPYE